MGHLMLPMLFVLGADPATTELPAAPKKEPTAITKYLSNIELPDEWERRWEYTIAIMQLHSIQKQGDAQARQKALEEWGWFYTFPPLPKTRVRSKPMTSTLKLD